jgi:ubiquinone/menaquinone biosynthesis C-methylase UbiE
MALLAHLLHAIASNPRAYDLIQRAAGRERIYRQIRPWVPPSIGSGFVVDVGGGTGASRSLLSPAARHVSLEIDSAKIAGYRRKYPDGFPIQANANSMPLADECASLVLMIAVSHHLGGEELRRVFGEIRRILTQDGAFLFVDASYSPARPASRLLWSYDPGAHPRTDSELRAALTEHFRNVESATPSLWHHRYLVCRAEPLPRLGAGVAASGIDSRRPLTAST